MIAIFIVNMSIICWIISFVNGIQYLVLYFFWKSLSASKSVERVSIRGCIRVFDINVIFLGDLLSDMRRDILAWYRLRWPYLGSGLVGSAYFASVDFKNSRPWFRGYTAPRGYIKLVTRLRTRDICTGKHFVCIGWDLEAGCGWGVESRSTSF